MPLVPKTDSGLMPVKWMQRMMDSWYAEIGADWGPVCLNKQWYEGTAQPVQLLDFELSAGMSVRGESEAVSRSKSEYFDGLQHQLGGPFVLEELCLELKSWDFPK